MARSQRVRLVFLLALAAACAGCLSGAGHPGLPSMQAEYRIAPPDTLTITVRPEPEIAREIVVRPDGRISFDLIGDVEVRGHTVDEVRAEVTRRLKEFIVQPDVTVALTKSESRMFYVFGEVMRPGGYPLIGDATVLQAIGAAGGTTKFASEDGIRLVRPSSEGESAYPVHFQAMSQYGYGATNYMLQPGDVVYVPPTISAKIGYAIQTIFFHIQAILGLGGPAVTVLSGGAI